jgi:hypothetical protein
LAQGPYYLLLQAERAQEIVVRFKGIDPFVKFDD